jgi:dTDP-4-dehydrorhamnose reductase
MILLIIRSEDYPKPAKRPHYSVLDKTKIKNELGITIPHWKESLEECLLKL